MLCALVAACVVWLATKDGAVLMPDSMSYVGAAESLHTRGALRIPMADWNDADSTSSLKQFPPGYSIVLAAAQQLGASALQAPRIIAAFAALTSILLLIALLVRCEVGWWSLAAPLVILSVRGVTTGALTALSESLFVVTVLLTLYHMVRYPQRPWTYGIAAACASMVRYVGVGLVVSAVAYALAYTWRGARQYLTRRDVIRRDVKRALGAAVLAGTPGVIVIGVWQLRARANAVSTPMTDLRWSGNPSAALREGLHTVVSQIAPVGVHASAQSLLAAIVGIALLRNVVRAWRAPNDALRRLMTASLLLAAALSAVILYARLFVGDAIPFDDRILAPALLCAIIAAFSATLRVSRWRGKTVAVAWLAVAAVASISNAANVMTEREDYGAASWQQGASAQWLRANANGCTVFTNDPVAVYFATGRPSRVLPTSVAIDSVQQFGAHLRATHGLIVQYPAAFIDMADAGTTARAIGLTATHFADSTIVWTNTLAPCPSLPTSHHTL